MKNTINKNTVTFLSKKGIKELKKAIIQLENDKRKAINALHELDKSLGHDERLSRIEKISDLESIDAELCDRKLLLANSEIIPRPSNLKVAIGSVVDLIDKHGHLFRFTIVNSVEANPSDGRISINSPIGQNLLGKTARDIIKWGRGKKINRLKLIRII